MHLLLSGFEPFGGERLNPSLECVKAVQQRGVTGVHITALELDVDRQRAPAALLDRLEQLKPDALIMLGEAGGRTHITPERVAINVDDFLIPDHAGRQPQDEAIIAGAPAAYLSTLPLRTIVAALQQRAIPAAISNSAGTYLCNHVFYRAMHALNQLSLAIPAGFIHLPYLSDQVLSSKDCPSLPRATLVEAVCVCIQTCLADSRVAKETLNDLARSSDLHH